MKIKVIQAVAICNILGSANQADLGQSTDKIVDIYVGLLPYLKEYNEALSTLQREAQGKSNDAINDLVSAKALEKIANKTIEAKIPSLTMRELKGIGSKVKDFKLSNYQILHAIVVG